MSGSPRFAHESARARRISDRYPLTLIDRLRLESADRRHWRVNRLFTKAFNNRYELFPHEYHPLPTHPVQGDLFGGDL